MATIKGTKLADKLYGTDGNDSLYGYAGNDVFYASAGDDRFDGGAGWDRVDFSSYSGRLSIVLNGSGKSYVCQRPAARHAHFHRGNHRRERR